MRRRPLGKTGMSVTELALGTWGLSGDGYLPVAESEQDRVIDRALALGITLYETADSYAHGEMERRLGRRLPNDGRVRVATKIGTDLDAAVPRKRFDSTYTREAVERSRERLGRDVIDVVLLHNPSLAAVEKAEATTLLAELAAAKKIRAWGVSAGSVEIARAAIGKGAQVISLAFNALHSSDLAALAAEIEKKEVGVLAHSVLGYGILTGHWSADKVFPDGDHRAERWTSDELRRRIRQLDALRPTVGGAVMTLRSAALRYVLSNRSVSSAVIGPRSSLQLDQLVREAGKGPPYLADDALGALRNRLRQVGVEV
jgi:aryl-alcohol dehydrogenase-like predicted oxidoreductase